MTQEQRIEALQREVTALQQQLARLAREVQAMTDIWRGCVCFGVTQ